MKLLLSLFLFLPLSILAQPCVFVAVASSEAASGTNTCVDIALGNDQAVNAFSWTVIWDPTVLSFTEVTNLNPQLDPAMLAFNNNLTNQGKLPLFYFTIDTPLNFPTPENLLSVCFEVIGGDSSTVTLGSDPTGFEVTTETEELNVCYQAGEVTVASDPITNNELIIIGEVSDENCAQGTDGGVRIMPFFGTTPYTYLWEGPNNFLSTEQNIATNTGGDYALTVTDINGQTATEIFFIDFVPGTISDYQITANSCIGATNGAIDINVDPANGPFQFIWSNGDITEDISDLVSGNYSVTVIGDNGCAYVGEFEVPTTADFLTSVSVTDPTCPGEAAGSIELEINPSSAFPFTYSWSNGATSPNLDNLSGGTYSLEIVDAEGCSGIYEFEVAVLTPPTLTKNLWCATENEPNGRAGLLVQPFSSDYTFQWSDGNTENSRDNLLPGTYPITISNSNNCILIVDTVEMQQSMISYRENYYSCDLDTIQLAYQAATENIESYSWTPVQHFDDPTSPDALYLPPSFNDIDTITGPPSITSSLTLNLSGGCRSTTTFRLYNEPDCVWPGDTDNDREVTAADILQIGLANGSMGTPRTPLSTEWFAQPGLRWETWIPGTGLDQSFVDADGNGVVNADDTLVVVQNYGFSHFGLQEAAGDTRELGAPLIIDLPEMITPDQHYQLDILLGNETEPLVNAYGISFRITYDPALVDPDFTAATEMGWLSDSEEIWDLDFNAPTAGILDVVMVRTDGTGISGQGKIGELSLQFLSFAEDREVMLNLSQVQLIDPLGNTLETEGMTATGTLEGIVGTTWITTSQEHIFPNPAADKLWIETDRVIDTYHIYDVMGKLVDDGDFQDRAINVASLSSGVYYIKLKGPLGFTRYTFLRGQ